MINYDTTKAAEQSAPLQRKKSLQAVYLEDNRHKLPVQKKKAATSAKVVQRAIVAQIFDDTNLSQEDMNKLTQVKQYMDTSLKDVKSKITTLFINIIEKKGSNPATTKLNDPGTAIDVKISSWFIHTSSVGDILGMLSHEIGVHTLSSNQMTPKQKEEELDYEKSPFQVRVGLHTHIISPWDDDKTSRQHDHVNVGRDKGGRFETLRNKKKKGRNKVGNKKIKRPRLDKDSVNARAVLYAKTTLRMGDAIEADNALSPAEKDKRLHDLMNSFLFDYARIIATDDRGMRSLDKAFLVSQVYNWYRDVIIVRYGNDHPWLKRKSMQPNSSGWGLRAYLLSKVIHALGTQYTPGGIVGTVVGGTGNLISSGVSLVGQGISNVTPGFVKQGLRGVDRVYGEVENLVVPNVVGGLGWTKDKLAGGLNWLRGK